MAGLWGNREKNLFRTITLVIICGMGLTGCTSTNSALRSWVGKSDIDLIKHWGKPDTINTFDNGEKIYTWIDLTIASDGPYTCQKSVTISENHTVTKGISRGCPFVVSYH